MLTLAILIRMTNNNLLHPHKETHIHKHAYNFKLLHISTQIIYTRMLQSHLKKLF